MSTISRSDLHHLIDELPDPVLTEAAHFLEFLRFKLTHESPPPPTPYTPITLKGLWKEITITDDDIAAARQEMWQGFGEVVK